MLNGLSESPPWSTAVLPRMPVLPNTADNSLDSWKSPQDSSYLKLDLHWPVLVVTRWHHKRPASIMQNVHRLKIRQWHTGLKIRQAP